jgi:23S rRNA (pseudouridine1915-N3)-methyltransferase
MDIKLIAVGKTDKTELDQLIKSYQNRLMHYVRFSFEIIPDLKNSKNLSKRLQKEEEGKLILSKISNSDRLILLDENGQEMNSVGFSDFLQKQMTSGLKRLVLVIGGPYGFSEDVYKKASSKLALSKMTFSHQMVRLFIIEQLYRSFTILKNEPYHHR